MGFLSRKHNFPLLYVVLKCKCIKGCKSIVLKNSSWIITACMHCYYLKCILRILSAEVAVTNDVLTFTFFSWFRILIPLLIISVPSKKTKLKHFFSFCIQSHLIQESCAESGRLEIQHQPIFPHCTFDIHQHDFSCNLWSQISSWAFLVLPDCLLKLEPCILNKKSGSDSGKDLLWILFQSRKRL